MKRNVKLLVLMIAVGIPLVLLMEYSPLREYIRTVKWGGNVVATSAISMNVASESMHSTGQPVPDTELLRRIQEQAPALEETPINARVDRVWKAIPGYNGIAVDIERTYEWNRKHPSDELIFLFREIKPEIGLEDLGAEPIYKGNPNKQMAGFMINVAWGDEYLPAILSTLEEEDVRATFFFDGSWLHKNLDTARDICEAGHECSNHAYSHKNMSELSRSRAVEEISKTEKLLKDELGIDNKWFAPPSGDYDQETVEIAYEMGLRTVLWTLDTVDWKKPEPEWIVRRISANLEPGSLILMHPTSSSSQALKGMIKRIRAEGYRIGTVSEVLSSDRVTDIETVFDF